MPGQDCLCTPVGSNLQVNRLGRFVTRPPSLDLFRPTVVIGSSLFFFFFFCGLKASSHLCPSSPIVSVILFSLFLILLFPRLFLFGNQLVINFAIGRSSFVPFCTLHYYYTYPCASRIYSRAIILDDQESTNLNRNRRDNKRVESKREWWTPLQAGQYFFLVAGRLLKIRHAAIGRPVFDCPTSRSIIHRHKETIGPLDKLPCWYKRRTRN